MRARIFSSCRRIMGYKRARASDALTSNIFAGIFLLAVFLFSICGTDADRYSSS
jgi:hypothetical protein